MRPTADYISLLYSFNDLSVLQHIADKDAVMYLGKFVEEGTINEVFNSPMHPYARVLLSTRPTFSPNS